MKIVDAQVVMLGFQVVPTIRTARAIYEGRRGAFLKLTLADGRTGMGEATPLDIPEDTAILERVALALTGKELPDSVDAIAAVVEDALPEKLPASRYALELSLLDLLAKGHGVPVARLLNPSARTSFLAGTLLSADAAADLVVQGRTAVDRGYRTLKVKAAALPLDQDLERFTRLREAVGPSIRIRADANGAWTFEMAKDVLERMRSLDLELVEQPISPSAPGSVEALERLRDLKLCPVFVDESMASPRQTRELLLSGGRPRIDGIVLKPTVLGGLIPSLRMARNALELGVAAYVTHALEGPVGRAGVAHLAAAIPQSAHACGVGIPELEVGAFKFQDGRLIIPETPGLSA